MNQFAIEHAFRRNFEERGEIGASVSIWKHGEEVVSLSDGWCEREHLHAWTAETLVPFYSVTKGLSAATLLVLLEKNGLTPESKIIEVWQNFPQSEASFSQLMSHQLGLAALDVKVDVYDHSGIVEAVENQDPNWQPGTAHGYHARMIGPIWEELVRLLSGKTLGEMWRELIADPLGLDAWIGLPEREFNRVATLYTGKQNKEDLDSGFYSELHRQDSLVRRAFFSPRGMHAVRDMNTPKAWQSGLPAMGGVGSARAVAKFYQAACGAIGFFSKDVMQWMSKMIVSGEDLVLQTPTAFSCGFQLDPINEKSEKLRCHYGVSKRAFGHPGAGGSHAFGDPENGISFAYVMNQMELSPLPGPKSLEIMGAIYA